MSTTLRDALSNLRAQFDALADTDMALVHVGLVREKIDAALAQSDAQPAGWKLVPLEPTPEMMACADRIIGPDPRFMRMTWTAMLAAAQSPAASPQEAQPMQDAYVGAREDLLIWKRRALEAEKQASHLAAELAKEVNGPSFMGEPAEEAQPERLSDAEIDVICSKPECWSHPGLRAEFLWLNFARAVIEADRAVR